MSFYKERRKHFKREARIILRCNYARMTGAAAIMLLLFAGVNAVKINLIRAAGLEFSFFAMPAQLLFDLAALLFAMPMIFGILKMAVSVYSGAEFTVGTMFDYFKSADGLMHCYRATAAIFVRTAAFLLPFLAVGSVMKYVREELELLFPGNLNADLIMLAVTVIYLICAFAAVVTAMRYAAFLYLCVKNPEREVCDMLKKSAALMRGNKAESAAFFLSFAPLAVVSIFTAGLLFIFFTIPYILFAYVSFMSYLYAEKNGDELASPVDYIIHRTR